MPLHCLIALSKRTVLCRSTVKYLFASVVYVDCLEFNWVTRHAISKKRFFVDKLMSSPVSVNRVLTLLNFSVHIDVKRPEAYL